MELREEFLHSVFVVVQNVVMFVLSVPILVLAILLAVKNKECATFMDKPVIAVGALLMFISLTGLFLAIISNIEAKKWKLYYLIPFAHLIVMFCLVILLFCFAIFALEITNSNLAHHVTNSNKQIVTEYRLYEYPKWMRARINRASYWDSVKQCLVSKSVCGPGILPTLFSNISSATTSLTPVQGGCCRPPSACNITGLGLTAQMLPKRNVLNNTTADDVFREEGTLIKNARKIGNEANASSSSLEEPIHDPLHACVHNCTAHEQKPAHETLHAYIHDCSRWSNLPNILCFDCDTCKAGVIQSSMDHWRVLGKIYVVLVMIMVIQYALLACYGFGNKKEQSKTEPIHNQQIHKVEPKNGS